MSDYVLWPLGIPVPRWLEGRRVWCCLVRRGLIRPSLAAIDRAVRRTYDAGR